MEHGFVSKALEKVGVVAWLPTIYLLINTSALLGFGKLGDNIGYKKVFLMGMGVSSLGALACMLAPSFSALLIARAFQSLGQVMYSPMFMAQVVIANVSQLNIMLNEAKLRPDIMLTGFRGVFVFGIVLALLTLTFSCLAKDKAQA